MRELCKSHNLALAPDGKCIVCRRSALTVFSVRQETEDALGRIVTVVLGACLLVAFGGLVYVWRLDPNFVTGGSVGATQWTERAVEDAPSHATPRLASSAPKSRPAAQPTKPRGATHRGPLPPLAPSRLTGTVRIVMYGAPWCYVCDRARDFLRADVVELVELDVERDPVAARALVARNPMQTLPTFEVSGETLVGFSPIVLEQAVRAALSPPSGTPGMLADRRDAMGEAR